VIIMDYVFEKIETGIKNVFDKGLLEHERKEILALVRNFTKNQKFGEVLQ